MIRAEFVGRTCRGFHPWPRLYPGLGGVKTRLLVWLWWAWVVEP